MYYYFYKITNNINGKYYYGVHSTTNINDGYMGSGKHLGNAINKYGESNFTKTIMRYFVDKSDMYSYEKLIVNKDMINDPMCYNLKCGGIGGMQGYHHSEETRKKISDHCGAKRPEVKAKISEASKNMSKEIREKIRQSNIGRKRSKETCEKISKANTGKKRTDEQRNRMKGHSHKHTEVTKKYISECSKEMWRTRSHTMSEEHKQKLSESHKGKPMHENTAKSLLDSTKGTLWVNNGLYNKRIKKNEFEYYKDNGFVHGMLIK